MTKDRSAGQFETVATFDGPMPTGVTISRSGRIFVNFPKWGDKVDFTVAEVKQGRAVAYSDASVNAEHLISVQSVVIDPLDRLWIVDTGSIEFGPTSPGGPKLVGVDLSTNKVFKTITFPENVAPSTSYLNDVRFDLRRGEAGYAFLTDSSSNGPNGLIVVDLATGKSWRRLHDHPTTKADPAMLALVEGRQVTERPPTGKPKPVTMGSDGIAISHDGSRLYYCPLVSRRLYSVSVDALIDGRRSDAQVAETVLDHGEKGASDGLEVVDVRVFILPHSAALLSHEVMHRTRTIPVFAAGLCQVRPTLPARPTARPRSSRDRPFSLFRANEIASPASRSRPPAR